MSISNHVVYRYLIVCHLTILKDHKNNLSQYHLAKINKPNFLSVSAKVWTKVKWILVNNSCMHKAVSIQQLNNMNCMQYTCQYLHASPWQPNHAMINYRRKGSELTWEELPNSEDVNAVQTTTK